MDKKKTLITDLSGRLGSETYITIPGKLDDPIILDNLSIPSGTFCYEGTWYDIEEVVPYLRSLYTMTDKEKEEIEEIFNNPCHKYEVDLYGCLCTTKVLKDDCGYIDIDLISQYIDYLNRHHFDFRDLIEKGLAKEATKGMYEKQ